MISPAVYCGGTLKIVFWLCRLNSPAISSDTVEVKFAKFLSGYPKVLPDFLKDPIMSGQKVHDWVNSLPTHFETPSQYVLVASVTH